MSVKSHRQLRHEIEHNELADWLAERIELLKPHATAITLGIVAVLVILLGSIYYYSTKNQASAGQWATYFDAFNQRPGVEEKELEQILADQPGSVVAMWAAQSLGVMNLENGSRLMFSNRTLAKDHLEKAEGYFKRVESGAQDEMLVARARLGLGKVQESLAQPKAALKYYEEVAAAHKGKAIGIAAERAAARMRNSRNVELLAWFAKQEPREPVGMPGSSGIPGLPNDLPERPDISVPDLGLDGIGTGDLAPPEPDLPKPGDPPPLPAGETPPSEPEGTEPTPERKSDAEPKSDTPPAAENPE